MRTVKRVYADKEGPEEESVQVLGTIAIRFQIDEQTIDVWFVREVGESGEELGALRVASTTGALRVRPTASNAIKVESVPF